MHALVREIVPSQQAGELPPFADHDFGIEGKPARDFVAESRLGDRPPDHERARRADVDSIEVPQLFGERRRPEGPVTAYVDAPQKNHKCHTLLLMNPSGPIIRANRKPNSTREAASDGRTRTRAIFTLSSRPIHFSSPRPHPHCAPDPSLFKMFPPSDLVGFLDESAEAIVERVL
jgi:hypothetical protein